MWLPEGTSQVTLPYSRTQHLSHPEPLAASQASQKLLQVSGCLHTLSSDSASAQVHLVAPTRPAQSALEPSSCATVQKLPCKDVHCGITCNGGDRRQTPTRG